MTNHQDKELSGEQERALEDAHCVAAANAYFGARSYLMDTTANRNIFDAGFKAAYRAASPQLPVSEQPAWQAVSDETLRKLAHECGLAELCSDGFLHCIARAVPDDYVLAFGRAVLNQHSPVAQMSGDTAQIIAEMREEAHERRVSDDTAGIFADEEGAAQLEDWADRLASHPSNAATQDELAGYRAAIEKIQRLCDAGVTVEAKAIEEVIWNIPAATVPQVVQAPKTEAWLIERYDANDKLERRVVLSPLSDDVFLDESSEAIALCRVDALLTTASNAGEAAQETDK